MGFKVPDLFLKRINFFLTQGARWSRKVRRDILNLVVFLLPERHQSECGVIASLPFVLTSTTQFFDDWKELEWKFFYIKPYNSVH
jgi:hypothetical protein